MTWMYFGALRSQVLKCKSVSFCVYVPNHTCRMGTVDSDQISKYINQQTTCTSRCYDQYRSWTLNKHYRQTMYNRSHKLHTERQSKFPWRISMAFEWVFHIKMELNRKHAESSGNTRIENENQNSHYGAQILKWKRIINRKGLRLSISREMAVKKQASAAWISCLKSKAMVFC